MHRISHDLGDCLINVILSPASASHSMRILDPIMSIQCIANALYTDFVVHASQLSCRQPRKQSLYRDCLSDTPSAHTEPLTNAGRLRTTTYSQFQVTPPMEVRLTGIDYYRVAFGCPYPGASGHIGRPESKWMASSVQSLRSAVIAFIGRLGVSGSVTRSGKRNHKI